MSEAIPGPEESWKYLQGDRTIAGADVIQEFRYGGVPGSLQGDRTIAGADVGSVWDVPSSAGPLQGDRTIAGADVRRSRGGRVSRQGPFNDTAPLLVRMSVDVSTPRKLSAALQGDRTIAGADVFSPPS